MGASGPSTEHFETAFSELPIGFVTKTGDKAAWARSQGERTLAGLLAKKIGNSTSGRSKGRA